MAASTTVTIKSRPLASGAVSWSLWIRRPRPAKDELIKLEQFSRPADRRAVEKVAETYRKAFRKGLSEPGPETCADYFKRWADSRRAKYPNQVEDDEAAFRLWIGPELGSLPMRAVKRERLIAFSHHLDTIAATGEKFAESRARNIFSVVSAMFRDAHSSKDATLRVLEANPCADVPWPDKATTKALKQLLYPNEFLALVSCPDVPLVRARFYAMALYTMTRPGETRVLEGRHIDVTYRTVRIVQASDSGKKGATKSTKSGRARIVTLEPNLAPLAFELITENPQGRLFPDRPEGTPKGNQWRPACEDYIPGPDGAYGVCGQFKRDLRRALEWAGIKIRPELFDDSDRTASISVRAHDLRASGITWRHARGDNAAVIRQECGHEDQAVNELYIRSLRSLDPADLFPPLPARLLGNGASPDADEPPCDRQRGQSSSDVAARCEGSQNASETPCFPGTDDHSSPSAPTTGLGFPEGNRALTHSDGSQFTRGSHAAADLDLERARVLAGAARDLLRGGLHVQARPLVEELAALLYDAAGRQGAAVVDLTAERSKRRT